MADDLDDDLDDDLEESDGKKAKKKKGGLLVPILVGLVLAMGLGIGAAVAVITGVAPIPGLTAAEDGEDADGGDEEEEEVVVETPVFIDFEELELTVGRAERATRLRLRFAIETTEPYAARVEEMKPRILDALNTLLRATDPRDLAEPRALARLRAQMLRRVRLAADPTAIRDLLITEYFVY